MVKFTNIVALGLVLAGISTTASPVINEQRDIERRTTSLSCGWAKKDGVDMGCMCNLPGLNLNLDLGGLNILSLGLKQYPPGCKPTCDASRCAPESDTRVDPLIFVCPTGQGLRMSSRFQRTRRMQRAHGLSSEPLRELRKVLPVRNHQHERGLVSFGWPQRDQRYDQLNWSVFPIFQLPQRLR